MINSLLRRFGPSHWLKGWLLRFALASDLCKISDGKAQAMQPPWSCADAEPTRQWEASLPHISSSSWNHAMMLTFMQIQIRRIKVPFLWQDLGKKTPVRHSAISRFGMDSWHTFRSLNLKHVSDNASMDLVLSKPVLCLTSKSTQWLLRRPVKSVKKAIAKPKLCCAQIVVSTSCADLCLSQITCQTGALAQKCV